MKQPSFASTPAYRTSRDTWQVRKPSRYGTISHLVSYIHKK